MKIINDILDFINKNELPESLTKIEEVIGRKALRVVSIKILSWLKSQNRTSKNISLVIKNEYDWCNNLKLWLSCDELLSSLFSIHSNKCDFLPTINENTREKIKDIVDQNYKPPLMR